MNVLSKLIALVMLALWLPATLHCDLEAADFSLLTHEDHHEEASCASVCQEDACQVIEADGFTQSGSVLRVLAPAAGLLACVYRLLVTPPLAESLTANFTVTPPAVEVLHRTWAFARRTALPARAPDRLA